MPAARPQPVFQALPVYPEDLIRQGIAGRGRYRVSIDKKGKVRNVAVKTSEHPFLDDTAVQAIRTWTFEPVTKGLEAVAVSFDWTIDFDPARWPGLDRRAAPGAPGSYSAELERLLALAAGYCERLSAAALDFVCTFGTERALPADLAGAPGYEATSGNIRDQRSLPTKDS